MTTEHVTYNGNMRYSVGSADRRNAGAARSGVAVRRSSGTLRPSRQAYATRSESGARASGAARSRSGSARPTASGGAVRRQGMPNRGKRPAQSGWKRVPAKLRLTLACLVLLVCLFGLVRLVRGGSADTEETFVENVSINGVSLAGYTKEEGYALMSQLRDRSINTTYTLTYAGQSWSFSPASFSAEINFDSELERAWNLGHVGDKAARRQVIEGLKTVPMDCSAELSYDQEKLEAFIDDIAVQVGKEPINAEVTLTDEKPVITRASETGLALDKEEAKANLESLITTGQGETTLPVKVIQPTVVSDGMEMNVIARFSTDVSFRGPKSRKNVRLALNYFNQLAVYPGYTVDFNEIVGPRTEAAGFEKAPEYAGNETVEGVGGGVCQASTTLYNAAVMAGMTIIERNRHSMMVSYVEPSQDAAVEYGSKNFIFRNDSDHVIYIYTSVNTEVATVTIYGTRPEYFHKLESVIISQQESDRVRYEDDTEGSHVYYVTDQPKLKTQGHGQCESEGWIVAYDWDTKQEVSREKYSNDVYSAGWNVYWRGIHNADGSIAASST